MDLKRRSVLMAGGGAVAGAFLGLQRLWAAELPGSTAAMATGFGDLRTDPGGILDLPPGFSYRVIARAGSEMSDGLLVPGMADGMAAFANPGGGVRLVCNHELDPDRARLGGGPFGARHARFGAHHRQRAYDPGGDEPSCGGTTTLIYDPQTGRVARQWLSLTGTERNCAGGPTPWGAWLSCEESLSGIDNLHAREHGYVFEVPASADGLVPALALKSMGRFNHEAAAVDPRTGVVYLSEDRPDSLLYRYLPDQPGRLAAGGRLQALALRDWNAADTRNGTPDAPRMEPGKTFTTRWIDLDDVASADDSLRQRGHASGAALFARGEGLWWGNGTLYFACTSGGARQAGQVFRYVPGADEGGADEAAAPGGLDLFVESRDPQQLAHCDNLTVTPWGDLLLCEDTDRHCGLVGVRPDGRLYRFADNPYNASELAGACFAPDGRTLFVNQQASGLTLAIRGPFPPALPV